jgi:hypothetical protein
MGSIIRQEDIDPNEYRRMTSRDDRETRLRYGARDDKDIQPYKNLDSQYRIPGNCYPDFEKLAYERHKLWWEKEKEKHGNTEHPKDVQ